MVCTLEESLKNFIDNFENSIHKPDPFDAEYITRFEMQTDTPDILITNYSMLEYMLMRQMESGIWDDTKEWLNSSKENRLLIVLDEAHMYRGSSGGLAPLKKLIRESKDVSLEDGIAFEVIPSLRKRIRDEKGKLYLNPYNLSDWLPNAFMDYLGKIHE